MLDVPCGACSGSLNRSDCVYSYVCSVDVCQNPQEHQIGAYLHLCLYVCVFTALWEDLMRHLCREMCLKVCLCSGLRVNCFL